MKNVFKSKLMECVFKSIRIKSDTKYGKSYFMNNVLRCKRAEQTGDYEKAYNELLKLFERHLDKFAYGHIMHDSPSNNLTMIYNIPIECSRMNDSSVMYAVSAVYNLHKMGYPTPVEKFDWRKSFNNKFYLRACAKHEHLGEIRIITKEEYENPIAFHPEYKISSFYKFELSGEHFVDFFESYDDEYKVRYKVVKREWKHTHVFLECEGHYYLYCWQFSQG